MDKQRAAPLYGLAVALLWGLSFLSIKVSVAVIPPMTLAVARFVLAVAVLPLLALMTKEKLRVAPRDLPLLAAGGLVGVTIYFLCENNGVALLSASESSLVIGTIPVLTLLAERLFLGPKGAGSPLGARAYLGAALSVLGVALIVLRSGSGGAGSSPLGYLFMAGAAVSWVAYAFLTRPAGARYGKVCVTFWQSLFGLAGCLPFALAESASWRAPSLAVALNVAYLGLLCSAAGYWLYISAMDVLGAGRTSVFINLIPVVSVVAAYFVLGERLGAGQLAGGAVAVAGVYLATVPAPRRASPGSRRA
ncbi:MAG TPA: DMT family transporter [Spirochaetales bacterium]|nr:DMT family transporter [Spirochaetales bacterium]HRY54517.1 DMT family transporter [Spirochaetia bacterium]HRZ65881.1 DMT family transporter [Spirochaetia bacterium]